MIGILGGLGVHAHVAFEQLLLEEAGVALGRPPNDQDYPPWIVSSMPQTPDRTTALLANGESPLPAMIESARRLERSGADFGVIPCNTAHAFLDSLREAVELPIVDMVGETAREAVARAGDGKVGILGTTGTLRSGIYSRPICEAEREVMTPLDLEDGERLQEKLVMEPIYGSLRDDGTRAGGGIKSGAFQEPQKREQLASRLGEAASRLAEAGATILIEGCTEIPLVLGRTEVAGTPLLDPMAVAARACIEISLGRRPLPPR